MCTYQGEAFLKKQLESIYNQSFKDWSLWISDDGSKDKTLDIINLFKERQSKVKLVKGPQKGYVINFLSLLANPEIESDYYAFSDQDDIWETDKLERAVNYLKSIPSDIPALYCSRTRLIDINDKEIGFSPLFRKKPCLKNALVQNIAGGNTMVFNEAAKQVMSQLNVGMQIPAHDWWSYIAVAACNGRVYYDPYPSVCYRQHGNNLVGSNNNFLARLFRLNLLLEGRFRDWNNKNLEALSFIENELTDESIHLIDMFSRARIETSIKRIASLFKAGVFRQTILGNIGLYAGVLLKKI